MIGKIDTLRMLNFHSNLLVREKIIWDYLSPFSVLFSFNQAFSFNKAFL